VKKRSCPILRQYSGKNKEYGDIGSFEPSLELDSPRYTPGELLHELSCLVSRLHTSYSRSCFCGRPHYITLVK
jgi:hypothetical protein